MVIAGDISPMDVIAHLPGVAEDAEMPYVFVPSKAALGAAAATKRPTSVVLVVAPADDREKLDEVLAGIKGIAE